MTGTVSSTALAWLLTYAIHSTVLLAFVWLLSRTRRLSPGASELLWKSAMIGAIVTSSLQLSLDVRPAGTLMLERETQTASQRAPAGSRPQCLDLEQRILMHLREQQPSIDRAAKLTPRNSVSRDRHPPPGIRHQGRHAAFLKRY